MCFGPICNLRTQSLKAAEAYEIRPYLLISKSGAVEAVKRA